MAPLTLRKRLARILVFDPACGSGNILVIADIRTREIESENKKPARGMHWRGGRRPVD